MGVVRSRGESVDAASLFDGAVKKLQEVQPGEVSENKTSTLRALCEGADIQLHAPSGAERASLYAAWTAVLGGSSLVVCGTAVDAEAIRGCLSESKVEAKIVATVEEFKSALEATGCVLAPVAVAAAAYKGPGAKPTVERCIIDGLEPIIEHVSLSELEGFLLGFRETNADCQMVLIAQEASLHMSALSRRFLKDSKNCSIKGLANQDMQHVYYEVGATLLAKPQALCDLVELEAGHTCLVFCNSPSDADFADVILKKRGLSSVKLIGYVPQLKLSKAIHQVQKKEITTLVLTDVAARGVPLEEFDVVVNYSIPTDPEVYFHRYSPGSESKTKKVVSLVAPLDISNFHYLKKMGKLEFEKAELPSAEQLFVNKFSQLRDEAIEKPFLTDTSIATLVEKVLADPSAKEIIALLLHNTVSVLPSLKSTGSSARDESHDGDEEESGQDDRRPRGRVNNSRGADRNDRGADRNDRGADRNDRGADRGVRRGGHQDDFAPRQEDDGDTGQARRTQGRGRDRNDRNDRGGERDRSNDRERDGDRGDRDAEHSGEGRAQRPMRKPPVVVDKEARLYVGAGSKQGLSREKLTSDVIAACGVDAADIHRISVRECYTFIDVPEAVADQVVDKLVDVEVSGKGERYFVKRAVTLSIPREGAQSEEGQDVRGHDDDRRDDEGHDEVLPEQDGPTMLSVDDPA